MGFSAFSFFFLLVVMNPMQCFVFDLLCLTVLSVTVGFFVGFCIGVSNGKVSIRQNHHIKSRLSICCRYGILGILGIFDYQIYRS